MKDLKFELPAPPKDEEAVHDWSRWTAIGGLGSVLGYVGIGAMLYQMFKQEKTMTKFESTAIAFIEAICEKLQMLQNENDKLRKDALEAVPRKTYEETIKKLDAARDERNATDLQLREEAARLHDAVEELAAVKRAHAQLVKEVTTNAKTPRPPRDLPGAPKRGKTKTS